MTSPRPARRTPDAELLALSPGTLGEGDARALVPRVAAAVEGGLGAMLLREPGLSDRTLLELALRLREVLGPEGWLGIHDRVHVARAALADGAHLGFRSLPPHAARRAAGPDLALGFSAHAGDGPETYGEVDYLVFGPVRATPSKRAWLEPTGLDGLATFCRGAKVPVWALGGLEPADAAGVLGAGARGLAVLRGVLGAPDPRRAAREHLAALARARDGAPGSAPPS